jgi:uncharacterized protein (DUF305 family)
MINETTEATTPEVTGEAGSAVNSGGIKMAVWILLALVTAALGYWLGTWQGSGPGSDSAEAGFARDMITHHAQAVDMAILIRERSNDPDVRQLALDILLTQQAQIGQMQGWLNTWGYPIASAGPAMTWMGMPTKGLMPGMATAEQLNQLRTLEGEAAEVIFLQLMITHHLSGVEMGQAALNLTRRPMVRALANSMVKTQVFEIEVMGNLLEQKGVKPPEPTETQEEMHMP